MPLCTKCFLVLPTSMFEKSTLMLEKSTLLLEKSTLKLDKSKNQLLSWKNQVLVSDRVLNLAMMNFPLCWRGGVCGRGWKITGKFSVTRHP